MQESITFKNGDRNCRLLFTIRSLKEMEQELGFSLNLLFTPNVALTLRLCTIQFTQLGMKYGLQDKEKEDGDPYDFIQSFCDNGGSLDTLNAHILAAISATNLFTEGRTTTLDAIRKVLEAAQKELSPSDPSQSG